MIDCLSHYKESNYSSMPEEGTPIVKHTALCNSMLYEKGCNSLKYTEN
jgi:hypothetical protein